MTQEEKARAFDQIMLDAYELDDEPQRLFLTLSRYGYLSSAEAQILHAYHNAHKLLERP